MTQKELLYMEDAIEHETSIIKLCNGFLNKLDNEELISFIKEQINSHESIKIKLMTLLKEKANAK